MLIDVAKKLDLPITPDDLALLQSVLDHVCRARGYAHDSAAATESAKMLISLFQSGIRGKKQLVSMLTGGRYP